MTMSIAAVIILIAVTGFAIMKKKSKNKKESQSNSTTDTPASKPENSSEQELKSIMDSLLSLNILMRKDRDFPSKMTGAVEAVIDDLTMITPAMMERYPAETLTYEIKKIGKNHLYKTVKEYLDLSLESRKNQFNMFEKTIKSLHDISNRSRDIVEKNETAEFKTMANFLAGKFSG
ncbi:MAG: hypothetical protein PF690_15265 [Deltaproteobacteria bacterium]|jgi:hypothetical protein|nr:hypothetical protein [Deltaproteobacteria bacterium]